MSNATNSTRYERVKAILDTAAGENPATYGGKVPFWDLPLEQFLEAQVYGIRMIAPAASALKLSCCAHEEPSRAEQSADGSPPTSIGRGAASGLIRGLRGLPPFDRSQFPPLPWGGTPVAEADIQFISDWIDDGCPAQDHELEALPVSLQSAKVSLEVIQVSNIENAARGTFEAYGGSTNEYRHRRGEVKQRMNIDCMPEAQIEEYRHAFRELYNLNKWPNDRRNYNNQALIHQNHCQHGWERFLPWHRIYLYEFEQVLQDHCPGLTLPYWDWTMPQYCPEHPETGVIIPEALKCFLTAESIEALMTAKPPLPSEAADTLKKELVGKRFASPRRFFDAVKGLIDPKYTVGNYRKRFIDVLLATNALWYPLRYPAEYTANGKPSTITKTIHYHYPTADDIAQILSLQTFRDFGGGSLYDDSFGFLDQNPHNTMHIWTGGMNPDFGDGVPNPLEAVIGDSARDIGVNRSRGVQVTGRQFHTRQDFYQQPQFGDMFSNLTASYDPIFWPIHANVDRLWSEWQQAHPQAVPADLDAVLTPWNYTIHDTLDIARFGYEYVKSTQIVPVGHETPVGRFVSRPLEIAEAVRRSFRQAEVRLHRVPQLPRSCFIRVFLNLPDANADTPIDHENYAGYLAVFGHGPCYGGPGHCDLPPDRPRKYDLRGRSHNAPRNHRINVTKCAKRLLENGARRLQITLVVIGADYQEDSELLRLDGVSLNFLD